MIFFSCSRTEVLSHDEEDLRIFFPNSGSDESETFGRIRIVLQNYEDEKNSSEFFEGREREEPQVLRIPSSIEENLIIFF